ncbi:MAG: carbohydrate-binding family 9-like protein [Oscillospiraceae bacterium]|nr:carbohydrate-binding family 9-like protein [Oscillospiraceae bacterium]
MEFYQVSTKGAPAQFFVTHHRPEGEIAPKTEGYLQYISGVGFRVMMRCYEENPKATYTQPDDPVFKDSCMEVFLNCFPEHSDCYINVEVNANGAMRCGFGPGRANRPKVLELGLDQPKVDITVQTDYWQAEILIPESLLESLYQIPCKLPSGHKMRGNFYKCGEETDKPHWATWSAVERLDFHTPEYFGELILV